MNRKHLAGLIALNCILLLTLGTLSFGPSDAQAQAGGGGGDYLMIGGQTRGQINNTVYITDIRNGLMIGVMYDMNRRALVPIAGRRVADDMRIDADQ